MTGSTLGRGTLGGPFTDENIPVEQRVQQLETLLARIQENRGLPRAAAVAPSVTPMGGSEGMDVPARLALSDDPEVVDEPSFVDAEPLAEQDLLGAGDVVAGNVAENDGMPENDGVNEEDATVVAGMALSESDLAEDGLSGGDLSGEAADLEASFGMGTPENRDSAEQVVARAEADFGLDLDLSGMADSSTGDIPAGDISVEEGPAGNVSAEAAPEVGVPTAPERADSTGGFVTPDTTELAVADVGAEEAVAPSGDELPGEVSFADVMTSEVQPVPVAAPVDPAPVDPAPVDPALADSGSADSEPPTTQQPSLSNAPTGLSEVPAAAPVMEASPVAAPVPSAGGPVAVSEGQVAPEAPATFGDLVARSLALRIRR